MVVIIGAGQGTIYSDWFLPSREELNLMYGYLRSYPVGDFVDNYYWSSSEYDAYYAWSQDFANGNQSHDYKSLTYYVRCVRAF